MALAPTGRSNALDADLAGRSPANAAGASIDDTLRQVFIAPRVIDQRSVDELSETLRGLIREAATQTRSLLTNSGEVRGLSTQLRAATQDLQQRVDDASKVVPAIDERVAKVEALLESAGRTLGQRLDELKVFISQHTTIDGRAIAAQVREASDRAVAESIAAGLAEFEGRANATIQPMLDRLTGAADRLEGLVDRASKASERIEQNTQSAAAAETSAKQAADRAAVAADAARTAGSEIDALRASSLDAVLARSREIADAAEVATASLAGQVAQAHAQIDKDREAACDAVSGQTHQLVAAHGATFRVVAEEALAQARAAADEAAAAREQAAISAESVQTRVREAQEQMASLSREFAALDADAARRCVADTADAVLKATDAALLLREATGVAQRTTGDVSKALSELGAMRDAFAKQRTDVAEALSAGAQWLDSIRTQIDELRVQSPLESLQSRSLEREETLAKLILRADRIGAALDRLVNAAGAIAEPKLAASDQPETA